jgi:hypothetical protein
MGGSVSDRQWRDVVGINFVAALRSTSTTCAQCGELDLLALLEELTQLSSRRSPPRSNPSATTAHGGISVQRLTSPKYFAADLGLWSQLGHRPSENR